MTTPLVKSTTDDLVEELEEVSAEFLSVNADFESGLLSRAAAHIRELEDVLRMYSLPIGGDLNQDCAEFGGDAVHREIMRRTALGLPKVTPQ